MVFSGIAKVAKVASFRRRGRSTQKASQENISEAVADTSVAIPAGKKPHFVPGPTPPSDWGSALRATPQNPQARPAPSPLPRPASIKKASSSRLSPGGMAVKEAACTRASESLEGIDQFDLDQVLLDDWNFAYNGSWPLQLTGEACEIRIPSPLPCRRLRQRRSGSTSKG